MRAVEEKPTGNADPASLRVTYGYPEEDLARQCIRHKRFYVWTENGRKCGSWTWQDGYPPLKTGLGDLSE